MERQECVITAGELRKMIANVADDELILFMKEDNGVGYNATSIRFTPAETYRDDEENPLPAILWVID